MREAAAGHDAASLYFGMYESGACPDLNPCRDYFTMYFLPLTM